MCVKVLKLYLQTKQFSWKLLQTFPNCLFPQVSTRIFFLTHHFAIHTVAYIYFSWHIAKNHLCFIRWSIVSNFFFFYRNNSDEKKKQLKSRWKKVTLAIVVEGDPKAPFSIATTPRCRERHYSFPWIAPLYLDLYLIMLSVKQGGIKYHFLSL